MTMFNEVLGFNYILCMLSFTALLIEYSSLRLPTKIEVTELTIFVVEYLVVSFLLIKQTKYTLIFDCVYYNP